LASVWAVEYSPRLFFYLDENIAGADLRTRFGSVCDVRVRSSLHGLDMVVANPPYISTAELPGLGLDAEPSVALDGARMD
jgi:methylase of polypeptide subunit release factors